MLELFKKMAADTRIRAAVVALVLALAAFFGYGCASFGQFRPEVQARIDVYECQLEALAESVPMSVAEDLVMAARVRNIAYVVAQLEQLGLRIDEINALADAFNACDPPEPVVAPAPAPLTRT